MKCQNCGAILQAKHYGKHVTKCLKSHRDLLFFAQQAETQAEQSVKPKPVNNKGYPIGGVTVKFPYKPYPVQVLLRTL